MKLDQLYWSFFFVCKTNQLCYNYSAIAMDNHEPGQDRNVAALSALFMCGGLFL